MFFRIDALKNFASFTGKHLCQCLFLIKLQASRQGFSSEIIFKNTFFYRTSLVTSSIFRTYFTPLRFSKTDLITTLRSWFQPFLTTRLVFNSVVKGIVLVFILLTLTYFTSFSSTSIVNFEQVNTGWVQLPIQFAVFYSHKQPLESAL